MLNERLRKIVGFWVKTEKLKLVERVPCLSNKIRRENDAEHSWHLALMVMAVKRELGIDFNETKALKLALVHDLPEIETGDTWARTTAEKSAKQAREFMAAENVFGVLPQDVKKEFKSLWREYEAGKTLEAKVVKALDKICYLLQYSISKKIVWPHNEETAGNRRSYALAHTKFNQALTDILDHLAATLDKSKTEKVDRL